MATTSYHRARNQRDMAPATTGNIFAYKHHLMATRQQQHMARMLAMAAAKRIALSAASLRIS